MDLSVVQPLDLTGVLGSARLRPRVAKIGVELEGAWTTLAEGAHLQRDGSVFKNRGPGAQFPHIGEQAVGPVTPSQIEPLLHQFYPHKVDKTCGMHVHMSFSTLWHYKLLMVPEYQETIVHYLKLWAKAKRYRADHHIWERLEGNSEYCRKGFWPHLQSTTREKDYDHEREGHRYTIIHYCGRLLTVECRVLPMMVNAALAMEAIKHVVDITNACLHVLGKGAKKPEPVNGRIELPGGHSYEEHIEYL